MKVRDLFDKINLRVVAGEHLLDTEVEYAFASDLMSDVLTLEKNGILLITGLSNTQALRTAEMSDISVLIIARNKKSSEEMRAIAVENDLVLLESSWSMFRISGELYKNGIKPVY
jgi:serine kinase of HPr protein (carbohydrate metabolism regulator)